MRLHDKYYYRARFYDPVIARFLSEDPIGLKSGDINFYNYVSNSPLIKTDPSGNGPLLGVSCYLVDVGYNAYSGFKDYDEFTTKAANLQIEISKLQKEKASVTGNTAQCEQQRTDLQNKISLLQIKKDAFNAQAVNAILGSFGASAAGGLICQGLLRLSGR